MAKIGDMAGDPFQKIAELEKRIQILEKIIQVQGVGVTIKAPATLKIESGANMQLRAPKIDLN